MEGLSPEERAEILRIMREKRVSIDVARRLARVSLHKLWADRRLGRFGVDEAAAAFDGAVSEQEAKVMADAEETLSRFASGKREGGGTRAEARAYNVQLHAAVTLLEKWCPERYGKTKRDELERLRKQAAEDLLDYLWQRLPSDVFDKVLDTLAGPTEPALEAGDSGE